MSIIEVQHVSFSYDKRQVVRNLDFAVPEGSFFAIAGPNGAGKTTVVKLLSRQLRPASGSIKIGDKPVGSYSERALAEKVAVVSQEFVPVFGFSVAEVVLMARTAWFGPAGFESGADRRSAESAMEMTDVTCLAERQLNQLSGGERQRVFIAAALAQDTPIIMLDEPTSFLDLKNRVLIYDLLKRLQQQGRTIITVTHDINLAIQYAGRVLLVGSVGDYMTGTCGEVLTCENIDKFFSVKCLQARVGGLDFFVPAGRYSGFNQT